MGAAQANLHKVTEALGIGAGAYLLWLSTQLPPPHNTIVALIGGVTLVVDAYLINTW